jgi:hypothetical protein
MFVHYRLKCHHVSDRYSKRNNSLPKVFLRCPGGFRYYFGWLLSNAGKASDLKTYGAIIGVAIITISALFVHKRIEHLISALKEL